MECYIDLLLFVLLQSVGQFSVCEFLVEARVDFSFCVGMVLLAPTSRCYSYSVCLLAVHIMNSAQ